MTKEQKSIENRERREWLKSLRMCVHCGKAKAEKGKVLCGDCAYKNAERRATRWRRLSPEQKQEHYDKCNRYRKKQREERSKNGLCVRCGRKLSDTSYKTCYECRARDRRTAKQRRMENGSVSTEVRYSGLVCCQCCKPIKPNKSKLCAECYERCVGKAELMRKTDKWRENITKQHDYNNSKF